MISSKKNSQQDLFELTQDNLEQQLWSIVILLQSIFRPTSIKKLYGIESFHLEQHLKGMNQQKKYQVGVGMKIGQASPQIKQGLSQYHSDLLKFWQVYRKNVNLNRNDEKKLQILLQKAQTDLKKIIDDYKYRKNQQSFNFSQKFNYPKSQENKKKKSTIELNKSAPTSQSILIQQKLLDVQQSQQSINQRSQGNEYENQNSNRQLMKNKELEQRNNEIDAISKEKIELQNENEFLKGMVEELQNDIQRYKKKDQEQSKEITNLKQENEQLRKEVKYKNKQNQKQNQQFDSQNLVETQRKELEQNQFLINQLKNKVETYEQSLQQRDDFIQDLKDQLLQYQQSRKNSPTYQKQIKFKHDSAVKSNQIIRYINVPESYVSSVINLLANIFSFVDLIQLYEDSDPFCGILSQFFQFMKGDYNISQQQLANLSQQMVQQIEFENNNFSNDFLFYVIDNVSHIICKEENQQESYISQLLKTVDSPVFDLFFFCQRVYSPEKEIQPQEMPLINSIKQVPYIKEIDDDTFNKYLINLSKQEGHQCNII